MRARMIKKRVSVAAAAKRWRQKVRAGTKSAELIPPQRYGAEDTIRYTMT